MWFRKYSCFFVCVFVSPSKNLDSIWPSHDIMKLLSCDFAGWLQHQVRGLYFGAYSHQVHDRWDVAERVSGGARPCRLQVCMCVHARMRACVHMPQWRCGVVILSPSPCGVRSPFNTSHPAANGNLEFSGMQIYWPFLIHQPGSGGTSGAHSVAGREMVSPPASS